MEQDLQSLETQQQSLIQAISEKQTMISSLKECIENSDNSLKETSRSLTLGVLRETRGQSTEFRSSDNLVDLKTSAAKHSDEDEEDDVDFDSFEESDNSFLISFLTNSRETSEIPANSAPPDSFKIYFGDSSRIYSSNALMLNNSEWQPAYLFLCGHEMYVYSSDLDDPADPIYKIDISTAASPHLGHLVNRPFALKFFSNEQEFTLCFRTARVAYQWANFLSSTNFPRELIKDTLGNSLKLTNTNLPKYLNVTVFLLKCLEAEDTSVLSKSEPKFGGIRPEKSVRFGYIFVSELVFDSANPSSIDIQQCSPWYSRFLVLTTTELRIFSDASSSDPESVLNIADLRLISTMSRTSEWGKRVFGLQNGNSFLRICSSQRDEWVNSIFPKR